MSEHEFDRVADELLPAIEVFGWRRDRIEREHERDSRTYSETVWTNANGFIICEDDVSEELARELIRIARMLP